jgi:hypothetical protein
VGERTILVCDACGAPAQQTVGLRVSGRSLQRDVCVEHLEEIVKGARPARRGRRKGSTGGPASRAKGPAKAGRTRARKTSITKRRGRPRKQASG